MKVDIDNDTFVNPLASRFMRSRQAGPFTIVIFGASGDLTKRKLIPALFNLFKDSFFADSFSIIGFARREKTDEQFRAEMDQALTSFSRRQADSPEQRSRFLSSIGYVTGDFDTPDGFYRLKEKLKRFSLDHQVPENVLFYLATPPESFGPIIRNLNQTKLVSRIDDGANWSRIIIEKPFGHDLSSTWSLNGMLHSVFTERQVYRIDHYLGKETVQNILVFRLGNSIFEPLWNRRYIDNVQITVSESLGIGSRAGYFESSGIIRDMIQSHIMQVFSLVAMEPPASFETNAIRDEKAKVLKSLHPMTPAELPLRVVRGQYTAGSVGGEQVVGYHQEAGVAPGSTTDTYVALKATIDNWRWSGVPFYIRSGKRLAKRVTEVAITFKSPPHLIFDQSGTDTITPNVLRLRIQPQEGISLSLGAKMPGQQLTISPVRMDFMYANSFGVVSPEAYERLILDAITGDSTLFAREDEVELSWRFVDQITAHWHALPVHAYAAGEWGPSAADDLLASDNRRWVRL